ncbi:MAG: GDSL-type esterase/lipase family protein [Candidatus Alcyoniella australis]|nr:GDSL-type esterase/lipase family protein [Candidatus Alcyoniella australis]
MKSRLIVLRRIFSVALCALLLALIASSAHTAWVEQGTGLNAKYWRYQSLWDSRKPAELGGFKPEPGARLLYPDMYHVRSLYQRSTLEFTAQQARGIALEVTGVRSGKRFRFELGPEQQALLQPGRHTLSLDTNGKQLGMMLDGEFVERVESIDDYLRDLVIELGDSELELINFRVYNTIANTLSEQTDFEPRRVQVLGMLPVCAVAAIIGALLLLLDLLLVSRLTVRPWREILDKLALHYLPLMIGLLIWQGHTDQPIVPLTGLAISLFLRARSAILVRGLFSVRHRLTSSSRIWQRRIDARGMVRWSVAALVLGALYGRAALPYDLDAPELLSACAALLWAFALGYGTLLAALGRFGGHEVVRRYLWTFSPLALTLPWVGLSMPRAIVGPVLLCVLLLQFTFLTANRSRLRGYGLLMSLWLVVLVAGFELWMRSEPAMRRWEQPMGLGSGYVPDDSLFYIPKSLFVRREDFQMRDDFKVHREVNFRSGVIPFDKPPGVFRIIVIGGSNVYGDGVDELSDVFTEVLERRLNSHGANVEFEVINSGVSGYNSFQLMILDHEYLSRYEFDLSILYLNRNDLIHDEGPYTYRELHRMMQRGEHRKRWVPGLQSLLRQSFVYNYYTDLVVRIRMWIVRSYSPSVGISKNVNPPEDYAQNLRELISQQRGRGAQVILAAEYWGESAARNMDLKGVIPQQRELMQQIAEETGVPFVDVYGYLRNNYEVAQIVFAHDLVHCNQVGHQAIAELLERTLIENRLVPID